MPWTSWIVIALILLALDTMIRYVRFRRDPKQWTLIAAATGALLWSVAWIVLSLSLRYSLVIAVVQAALFGAAYIAIILLLGRRFLAAR